jgi:hypothetical protein
MSKVKDSKHRNEPETKKSREWPVVVDFGTFGLAIFGYTLSNLGVLHNPHSYHWLTGVLDAIAGLIIGWVWYRWRGDIV